MVNKCAAPKCTSGYARNEKKQIAKFHFPLRNVALKKQWISFFNRRDSACNETLVLFELHFEEKYLQRIEKCTMQCSINPVPTVYLSKPSSLPTQQTSRSLPRKRSFANELSTFQQRDIIRTFQELTNQSHPQIFTLKN